MTKESILSENHWRIEDYRQRIRAKEWKFLLLNNDDTLIFRGHMRKLYAKSLGAGVYEIYKGER